MQHPQYDEDQFRYTMCKEREIESKAEMDKCIQEALGNRYDVQAPLFFYVTWKAHLPPVASADGQQKAPATGDDEPPADNYEVETLYKTLLLVHLPADDLAGFEFLQANKAAVSVKQYMCRGMNPSEDFFTQPHPQRSYLIRILEKSFSVSRRFVMEPVVLGVASNQQKMSFGTMEFLRTLTESRERERLRRDGKLTPELDAEPVAWFWEKATTAMRQRG